MPAALAFLSRPYLRIDNHRIVVEHVANGPHLWQNAPVVGWRLVERQDEEDTIAGVNQLAADR